MEALTQALPGLGRSDKPPGWGAGVFVQVFDPAAFGGSAPSPANRLDRRRLPQQPAGAGRRAVRLPGQQALAKKRAALADGVALYPGIMEALKPWAEKLNVRSADGHAAGRLIVPDQQAAAWFKRQLIIFFFF